MAADRQGGRSGRALAGMPALCTVQRSIDTPNDYS